MSELVAYLDQFDHARSHAWESWIAALTGVREEEAFWQSPCYAADEREEGWPPPGSIAWQIAHLTHCKLHYTEHFRHACGTEQAPSAEWSPGGTLEGLRGALEAAHATQRAAIAALGEERLDLVAGNAMPLREFLAMCIRHDTWHASQIAVARRLYRTRADADHVAV